MSMLFCCREGLGWMGRGGQNGEDVPGLPTGLPQDLLLYPLSGASCQPRRAYLKGKQANFKYTLCENIFVRVLQQATSITKK